MNLSDLIVDHFRLNDNQKKALKKLHLKTIEELLFYFPIRYGDVAMVRSIGSLKEGEYVKIYGRIKNLKTKKAFRSKVPMAEATIEDESGSIHCVWFHQPYIVKMIEEGSFVKAEGKVTAHGDDLSFTNPEIETIQKIPTGTGDSLFNEEESGTAYPVYAESRGITSKWIFHAIQKIFKNGVLEKITDPLPEAILKKYSLPAQKTALVWIHTPRKESDSIAARKRFAFEEIFFIQLEKQRERARYKESPSFKIEKSKKEIESFIERFPFKATSAQRNAIYRILEDFTLETPMSRLLEGDVGSGKTAVAAASAYAVVTTPPDNQDFGNLQVAYMAPTEILAEQHFQSFVSYFAYLGINVGLITGSGCKKFPSKLQPTKATDISRSQLLKWVENGEIPILVGTHALIQKTVQFKNLAYVIIDEQHRFGTRQRQKLRNKDNILPHLLSMTATPIPRTLALTLYGDLDITLLDELPAGRKEIITEIILPRDRQGVYEKTRKELLDGRQAYVICPRIEEPDPTKEAAVLAKSVTEEAKRLKEKIFPEYEIGVLHGKLKPSEKESAMLDFKDGKTKILCATSVVEVGVNVPNATSIIIEGAERFGLSQLHQLRGRVFRSSHQAYCYIFTESNSEKTQKRLEALKTAKNGFELAEFDLAQRGAGQLYGRKQWGISDLGMEAIKNIKMVEAARTEAGAIVRKDPELSSFPLLNARLSSQEEKVHFE